MEDWRSIHSSVLCDSFFHIFLKARARSFAAVISFSFCNRRPYKSVVGQIFAVKVSAYEIQLVDNGKMLENTNWKGSEWTCECVCVCVEVSQYIAFFFISLHLLPEPIPLMRTYFMYFDGEFCAASTALCLFTMHIQAVSSWLGYVLNFNITFSVFRMYGIRSLCTNSCHTQE